MYKKRFNTSEDKKQSDSKKPFVKTTASKRPPRSAEKSDDRKGGFNRSSERKSEKPFNPRRKETQGEKRETGFRDKSRPSSSFGTGRPTERRSSERPPFKRVSRGEGGETFDRKDRSTGGSKPFTRREDAKPFEKRGRTGEGRKFDGTQKSKPFEKRESGSAGGKFVKRDDGKPFNKRNAQARPTEERKTVPYNRTPRKGATTDSKEKFTAERSTGKEGSRFSKATQFDRYPKEEKVKSRSGRGPRKSDILAEKKRGQKDDTPQKGDIRLNRYIANAGICSRREADDLIMAGLVTVNGISIQEMGYQVKPTDDVRYNGERLSREKKVYVLLNKPKDAITTSDDPEGRRTVMQLFGNDLGERIYPVGRLDRNTTGVLLFTNDGDLAQRLMHPKYEMTKVYKATLDKTFKGEDMWQLTNGVELEDGFIKPDSIAYPDAKNKKEVGIEIHSGKNHIIHRLFEHLGYEVDKLDRALYAGLTKGKLKRGEWRELTEKEVNALKRTVKLS